MHTKHVCSNDVFVIQRKRETQAQYFSILFLVDYHMNRLPKYYSAKMSIQLTCSHLLLLFFFCFYFFPNWNAYSDASRWIFICLCVNGEIILCVVNLHKKRVILNMHLYENQFIFEWLNGIVSYLKLYYLRYIQYK